MKRHFAKEDTWKENKQKHEKISSLATREMQIKIMMRYHKTYRRQLKCQNSNYVKCWPQCNKTGSLIYC